VRVRSFLPCKAAPGATLFASGDIQGDVANRLGGPAPETVSERIVPSELPCHLHERPESALRRTAAAIGPVSNLVADACRHYHLKLLRGKPSRLAAGAPHVWHRPLTRAVASPGRAWPSARGGGGGVMLSSAGIAEPFDRSSTFYNSRSLVSVQCMSSSPRTDVSRRPGLSRRTEPRG